MKQNITICLDQEIVAKLKKGGLISAKINELLIKYMDGGAMTKEDLEKSIIDSETIITKHVKTIEHAKKKLKELSKTKYTVRRV